jgi:hypothetical protein
MEQGPDELDREGVDREEQLVAETERPLDEPKPASDRSGDDGQGDDEERDAGTSG